MLKIIFLQEFCFVFQNHINNLPSTQLQIKHLILQESIYHNSFSNMLKGLILSISFSYGF